MPGSDAGAGGEGKHPWAGAGSAQPGWGSAAGQQWPRWLCVWGPRAVLSAALAETGAGLAAALFVE